ncbi:MAG: class I SAM-dependent methyltransferase [bacterium]|nr:class I SAM-dependent methyltransferase [bacterium]
MRVGIGLRIWPCLVATGPGRKGVVGIDSAVASLELGKHSLKHLSNCRFAAMNAARLGFPDNAFDVTLCIQNGMSAFHVNRKQLMAECVRVTKRGGIILFSTYAEKFWDQRLLWFRAQSAAGLLGPIDDSISIINQFIEKPGATRDFEKMKMDLDLTGLKPMTP